MSKIKIFTPKVYKHSDFFHKAVEFAKTNSTNRNEFCLGLSQYLVENFNKVWKFEKPRIYKKMAELENNLEKALETIKIQRMTNDALMEENLDYRYDISDSAFEQARELAKDWEFSYQEEIKELKAQLARTKKALELCVADKCKIENSAFAKSFGFINGEMVVPKKEEWYLEQAQKEMKGE